MTTLLTTWLARSLYGIQDIPNSSNLFNPLFTNLKIDEFGCLKFFYIAVFIYKSFKTISKSMRLKISNWIFHWLKELKSMNYEFSEHQWRVLLFANSLSLRRERGLKYFLLQSSPFPLIYTTSNRYHSLFL